MRQNFQRPPIQISFRGIDIYYFSIASGFFRVFINLLEQKK